jgi:hypothetical protein
MEFTRRVSSDAKFRCRKEKVREKYICLRHLRRILNKRELNYENIYPSDWSGCHARFGFVRVGAAGHDHNDHDAREHHGGAADGYTTDYDYLQEPLIASLSLAERAACSRALFCMLRRSKELAPWEFGPGSPSNAVASAVFSGL